MISVQEIRPQTAATIDGSKDFDMHWRKFRDLSRNVSGSEIVIGNSISIIEGVENIHQAMISDIQTSQSTILLSTFIFRSNDLGRKMSDALVEANRRGVDVKLLLDGVGNGFFRSLIFRHLKSGGVDTQQFLHSTWPWRMPLLNLRNHRKTLIIDGQTAYTGSMNI